VESYSTVPVFDDSATAGADWPTWRQASIFTPWHDGGIAGTGNTNATIIYFYYLGFFLEENYISALKMW